MLVPLGILFAGFIGELIGADTTLILNNIIVILFVLYLIKNNKKQK